MPLIELRGVDRVFEDEDGNRIEVLSDVTLAIEAGELVCITGPSGSGKSTLLNILGGMDRPTAGEYRFDGRDVTALDPDALARLRREEFGFVFQAFNLLGSATSQQNVELPARYLRLDASSARERAQTLLESLGLGERRDHRPGELSGGEQQRTSIARALMNGGRVILADEPTGALDSAHGEDVMSLLKELAARGHTVVIVSHDMAVAASADRRIELRDGRVAADSGTVAPDSPTPRPRVAPGRGRRPVSGLPALLRDALLCLRGNALRTALVALSVALGVGSVVALLSLAEGIERWTLEAIEANLIDVNSHGGPGDDVFPLAPADADAIRAEIPNVTTTHLSMIGPLPIRSATVAEQTEFRAETRTRPIAIDGQPWPLARGAFLTEEDSERRAQVVVLGPAVAAALFEVDADPIGEHVQVDGVPFLVKGVLERSPLPPDIDLPAALVEPILATFGQVAYVPFHTARDLLVPDDIVPEVHTTEGSKWVSIPFGALTIEVRVADPHTVEATAAAIRDLLIRRHGREGFGIEIDVERADTYDTLWGLHPVVQGGIAVVALLVAIVGVMATTLVAVGARRREIGIRMAIGARRRDIATQFLVEAVIAAFFGGAAGLVLGYWAGVGVAALATPTGALQVPVAFASWFVPVALCGGVATGLVASIVPARRAAQVDPVSALAEE